MEVTYSASKNAGNIRKHGISLARAEGFQLDDAFVVVDDSQDYGEVRYIGIGWIGVSLHVLVYTVRDGFVRAISLRKANKWEQQIYAEEN